MRLVSRLHWENSHECQISALAVFVTELWSVGKSIANSQPIQQHKLQINRSFSESDGIRLDYLGFPTHRSIKISGPICITPTASRDRKSTRLNSSHLGISYAVFCLKKKKKNIKEQ